MREYHANPLFVTPDDTTILTFIAARDVQRDLVWNANWARHVERCPIRRQVTNCAIDAAIIELNGPGFKNALSRFFAALFHAAASNAKN
jgi:hypothetical protein